MAGRLVLEGRVSLTAFLLGLSVLVVPLIRTWFGHLDWVYDYLTETPGKVAMCLQAAVMNGLLLLVYRGPLYKVRARAKPLIPGLLPPSAAWRPASSLSSQRQLPAFI